MIQIHRNTNEHQIVPLNSYNGYDKIQKSFEYSEKYMIVFVRSAPLALFLSLNYLNNRNLANSKTKTLYPILRETRVTHHKCVGGNTT